MKKLCYSLGYSDRKIDEFIELLQRYGINCVVDVRFNPYSKNEKSLPYNMDNIKITLNKHGIYYIFMGKELGARNKDCINEQGEACYEDIRKDSNYKKGIVRLIDGMNKGYNIVIMCAEKEPVNCHRAILIGYNLKKKNIDVKHIVDRDLVKSQGDIEEEIMKMYRVKIIKKVAQFSINSIMNNVDLDMDEDDFKVEMLEEAYRMRGNDIKYREEKIKG